MPGKYVVVDEIVSMWHRLDAEYTVDGMPHISKVARKPRGFEAEYKAICDEQTGIMLDLDLLEGQAKQDLKQYRTAPNLGESAAVSMGLANPWRHTRRNFITDGTFTSIPLAKNLRHHGLFIEGLLKTCSR